MSARVKRLHQNTSESSRASPSGLYPSLDRKALKRSNPPGASDVAAPSNSTRHCSTLRMCEAMTSARTTTLVVFGDPHVPSSAPPSKTRGEGLRIDLLAQNLREARRGFDRIDRKSRSRHGQGVSPCPGPDVEHRHVLGFTEGVSEREQLRVRVRAEKRRCSSLDPPIVLVGDRRNLERQGIGKRGLRRLVGAVLDQDLRVRRRLPAVAELLRKLPAQDLGVRFAEDSPELGEGPVQRLNVVLEQSRAPQAT